MADIRCTSTGRVFYRVDDCVAALLQEAFPASFEKARTPAVAAPPAPTEPRFYVSASAYSGNVGIFVQLPSGEVRSTYAARSLKAAEKALDAGPLPENVWEQFVAKTNYGTPTY